MYLNVIDSPTQVPAVRGLSGVMLPVPRMKRGGRGFRGLGQVAGCVEATFDTQMQSWLSSLSGEDQVAAAWGCGANSGQPCSSPEEASQMALAIAADYCNVVSEGSIFNCPQDPACADNGASAAQPYIAQALALFNSFPASVWAQEATEASSGQPAPSGPCPAGMFVQVGPGGVSCYGSTADQDLAVPVAGSAAQAAAAAANPTPAPVGPAPIVAPAGSSASTPATATPSNPLAIFAPVVAPASSQVQSQPSASDFSFLTNNVSMMGFDVPVWGLIAAGLGLFLIVRPK